MCNFLLDIFLLIFLQINLHQYLPSFYLVINNNLLDFKVCKLNELFLLSYELESKVSLIDFPIMVSALLLRFLMRPA